MARKKTSASRKQAATPAAAAAGGRRPAKRVAAGDDTARNQPSRARARKTAAQAEAARPQPRPRKASDKKPSTLTTVATAVRGTLAKTVAAVSRGVSRRRSTDAVVLLERDHRRMEDLLGRGEETSPRAVAERGRLLDTIRAELAVHELIEERLFYPALRRHPEANDIVLEGLEEHHSADVIVTELGKVAADEEQWGAKFKVLKETIQHHIDEEEGEMFRTARAVLAQAELDTLGTQMAAMKAEAQR